MKTLDLCHARTWLPFNTIFPFPFPFFPRSSDMNQIDTHSIEQKINKSISPAGLPPSGRVSDVGWRSNYRDAVPKYYGTMTSWDDDFISEIRAYDFLLNWLCIDLIYIGWLWGKNCVTMSPCSCVTRITCSRDFGVLRDSPSLSWNPV